MSATFPSPTPRRISRISSHATASVESVNVIMDRETGRPRGFAFVEMSEGSAAKDAIKALDGTDFGGRTIKVSEAQERQGRGGGGGSRY